MIEAQIDKQTVAACVTRIEPEPVACAATSMRLIDLARRVAASDCTVLIVGESGTGKEVLARFIHRCSPRSRQPFIAVNCAAIPENMLEAMLFGYERGAFTGAHAAHAGKFEQAQGGTLLLDEITEMPLGLQAKLLRVLQEREVERLGGRTPIPLDVRVLATTNRRLREEVAAGRFREDLYYRLNVFPLAIAPLRTRRDDVLPLAMQLLSTRCRPGEQIPALSADAAHLLLTYPWPGNVRELDNLLQRALILVNGPVIRQEHIQFELANDGGAAEPQQRANAAPATGSMLDRSSPLGIPSLTARSPAGAHGPAANGAANSRAVVNSMAMVNSMASATVNSLASSLDQAERDLILDALRSGQGNRREAAERLGISQRTLRYKLARLREAGIDVPAA
jgi:two-component system response regulator FlrC